MAVSSLFLPTKHLQMPCFTCRQITAHTVVQMPCLTCRQITAHTVVLRPSCLPYFLKRLHAHQGHARSDTISMATFFAITAPSESHAELAA